MDSGLWGESEGDLSLAFRIQSEGLRRNGGAFGGGGQGHLIVSCRLVFDREGPYSDDDRGSRESGGLFRLDFELYGFDRNDQNFGLSRDSVGRGFHPHFSGFSGGEGPDGVYGSRIPLHVP